MPCLHEEDAVICLAGGDTTLVIYVVACVSIQLIVLVREMAIG